MRSPLNILVLHRLGDPRTWRESMVEKELCLPRYAPENNYVIHDYWMSLPDYVLDIDFDAVILTQTFLGARQDPKMRERLVRRYGELLKRNTFKVALPQDDYTCSKILDDWLIDWDVALNYPVCQNNWTDLYPAFSQYGRMKQGYTGYLSEDLINRTASSPPLMKREVDVAYRAASLSFAFGRLGQEKSEYGKRFLKASSDYSLTVDISVRREDAILGENWYTFIQNAKCMLGTNSGSSLMDPDGSISKCVHDFTRKKPEATFEEVERACFPGLEGVLTFTAISPRNIECALFRTAQILAPGSYGGFLTAWDDYIPLEADMSNFTEVADVINDIASLQTVANRCRDTILSFDNLRYESHVKDIIEEVYANTRISDSQRLRSVKLIDRYREQTSRNESFFWVKHRAMTNTRRALAEMGMRKVKYFISDIINN